MPDFKIEDLYQGMVAGIDEAGRGPWVGPVVAAAVIVKNRQLSPILLKELNDSKKLTAHKREILYKELFCEQENGKVLIGIGEASSLEIDELNILQATFLAMSRAVAALPMRPDMALIDGNRTPKDFICPTKAIVKGDSLSVSIAAASIVAKVYRDKQMSDLAQQYPYYGFEKNAGYGTKQHIEGISRYGIIPQHRKSYKPIRDFLMNNTGAQK